MADRPANVGGGTHMTRTLLARLGRAARSLIRSLPGVRTLDRQRAELGARVEQLERELAGERAEVGRLARQAAEQREAREDLERRAGFVPPGHFYSPLPSLEEFEADRPRIYAPSRRATVPGIDLDDDGHRGLLEAFAELYRAMPFREDAGDDHRYHLGNGVFGHGDGIFLYAMLRHRGSRRVIEVGSGYSTAVMLDTSELFMDGALDLTLVEPYPDRLQSLLRPGDDRRITLIEGRVQDVPVDTYLALDRGDILFVDSTHVAKVGSDVNHLVFEVLPVLRPGVLVHIHDIGYPFEYPATWIREGRAWNEAYLMRAFLQFNAEFEVVFFAQYAQRFHAEFLETHMPLALRTPAGSLWIRRRD